MSSHNDSFVASGTSPTSKSVSPPSAPVCDLIFENHGSLFLIRPVSPAGQNFLDENVGDAETLTFGGPVTCEPRYVEPIYSGAIQAGLVISL